MSDSQQQSSSTILAFEGFSGLNTEASRPGIKDTQMAWCDGWMPIGESQLRTLYGIGVSIFLAPAGTTIAFFDFGNIATDPLCIAVPSNGSVWSIGTASGIITGIAPAGTILSPSRANCGITQWGNQFIILIADQSNGYFIFDGSVFYSAGTIAPTSPGSLLDGGVGYTSVPSYTVFGGHGSGVTLTPTISGGSVTGLAVTNPGTGYLPGDIVQVAFAGGGTDASPVLEAVLGGQSVASLDLVAAGSGYTNGTHALGFTGDGSGAAGTFTVAGGIVTSVNLTATGSGYTTVAVSFPGAGGSGAAATAALGAGGIASITIVNGGSNFPSVPNLTITGGGGSGATATATLTGGVITGVTLTAGGAGYTSAPSVEVQSGVNNAAYALLDVMPFGIQGTALETYQSRVWVANHDEMVFSSPESYTDFSTANGGGSFNSNDSFLRVQFIQPRQTNGFLYLIADSSVNYIAGVQSSGSPITTTFTNQNADPEVGTPYAATVDVLGSNIIFANAFGCQVSYGGRVTKVSSELDGIYNTVPNFDGFQPSAAKAIVFGKKIWMLLLPVIDLVSGAQVNKLLMWDEKKWWTAQQEVTLTYIQSQEIASVLTAFGTDGANIYPLFDQPSTALTKVAKSKLWSKPGGYMILKSSSRCWLLAQYFGTDSPDMVFSTDSEKSAASVTLTPDPTGITDGIYVSPPTALSQIGALLGITITTNASDAVLISAAVDSENVGYRG